MIYLNKDILKTELFGNDVSWLDTGTFDALLEASNYVKNNL